MTPQILYNISQNRDGMFVKMHGLGNDFIIFFRDDVSDDTVNKILSIDQIFNYKTGVGCDQLLVVSKELTLNNTNISYQVRIYNNDYTEAFACGNGMRCLGLLLSMIHDDPNIVIKLRNCESHDFTRIINTTTLSSSAKNGIVKVDMGHYVLHDNVYLDDIACSHISLGNDHFVIIANQFSGSLAISKVFNYQFLNQIGKKHAHQANISIINVKDNNTIEMMTYERGSGITQSCGSAACAACIASMQAGLTGNTAFVTFPQSCANQVLSIAILGQTVYMSGPATIVYVGSVSIDM